MPPSSEFLIETLALAWAGARLKESLEQDKNIGTPLRILSSIDGETPSRRFVVRTAYQHSRGTYQTAVYDRQEIHERLGIPCDASPEFKSEFDAARVHYEFLDLYKQFTLAETFRNQIELVEQTVKQ